MHITIMMEEGGRVHHLFYQGRIISWFYGLQLPCLCSKNNTVALCDYFMFLLFKLPVAWYLDDEFKSFSLVSLSAWFDLVCVVGSPTGTWPPCGWLWGRGRWPSTTPGAPATPTMTGPTPTQSPRKEENKNHLLNRYFSFSYFKKATNLFFKIYFLFTINSKVKIQSKLFIVNSKVTKFKNRIVLIQIESLNL